MEAGQLTVTIKKEGCGFLHAFFFCCSAAVFLEEFFNIPGNSRRNRRRFKAFYYVALTIDEEFRKVPFNAIAFEEFREVRFQRFDQNGSDGVIHVKALKAFLFRQIFKQGLCRFTTDIAFFKDLKSNAIVNAAEILDFISCTRILFGKLIARETEDFQAFIFILFVQFL